MSSLVSHYSDYYIHLFADCIPVAGPTRIAICDLTRNEITFIPEGYDEVLEYIVTDTVDNILNSIELEEERIQIIDFIEFLHQNEFIMFTKTPESFPPLKIHWDNPGIIQNAIIDWRDDIPDFDYIFKQLTSVGCQFVQLRSFSQPFDPVIIGEIIDLCQNTSIMSVELIAPYNPDITDTEYIQFSEKYRKVTTLHLHNAAETKSLNIDFEMPPEIAKDFLRIITFDTAKLDNSSHCGVISQSFFSAPTVKLFMENKLYNGCLNRKISIDEKGIIRNCPSMKEGYGFYKDLSFIRIASLPEFQEKWSAKKDDISVCRDCEFRYVCSDCRAFLSNPKDQLSKPLKCGYNPYDGTWNDWKKLPGNLSALKQYEFNAQSISS